MKIWRHILVMTIAALSSLASCSSDDPYGKWDSMVWNAAFNGKYFYPPREANDYHTITTGWFKAEISGDKLKVVFEANETAEERPLPQSH